MHGRLAIISLLPDISRVDHPVLHTRTMNDAIFSMIDGVRARFAQPLSFLLGLARSALFVGALPKSEK